MFSTWPIGLQATILNAWRKYVPTAEAPTFESDCKEDGAIVAIRTGSMYLYAKIAWTEIYNGDTVIIKATKVKIGKQIDIERKGGNVDVVDTEFETIEVEFEWEENNETEFC